MDLIQIYGTERSGSTLLGAQLASYLEGAQGVGEYQFVAYPRNTAQIDWPCVCGDPDCTQAAAQRAACDGFDLTRLFESHAVVVDTSKQIYWYFATARPIRATGGRVRRILILPSPEAYARSKVKRGARRFAAKYALYNLLVHQFCAIDLVIRLEDLIDSPDAVVAEVAEAFALRRRSVPQEPHYIFGSRTTRRLGVAPVTHRPVANAILLPVWARIRVAALALVFRRITTHPPRTRPWSWIEKRFARSFWRTRAAYRDT